MPTFAKPTFNQTLSTPLYQQLFKHLQAVILSGELKSGTKLPSTRALADELNLSRTTVLNAYQELIAEGYLETRPGSGTFVTANLPDFLFTTPAAVVFKQRLQQDKQTARQVFSQNARAQIAAPHMYGSPLKKSDLPRPFSIGVPALDAFPFKIWEKLVAQRARRLSPADFNYQPALAGYPPLREAIAAHLTITRRLHCTPEQIIIVPGTQGALDLAARTLINPGDPVWMEDPGYHNARGAFLGAGAHVVPVPVDQEGLVVEAGIESSPRAHLVYVSPSHQFPMGVSMSLRRRLHLLDWAQNANAIILEDDYDSEYRYSGRPLTTLQGLDPEYVIYIGSFSKVLFPALRIGYLVLPVALVEGFIDVRLMMDIHPPLLEQTVLTDFINDGHFTRHLRRMRTIYAERRRVLLDAVAGLPLQINAHSMGLHCTAWLPEGMQESALVAEAAAQELELWPISHFSTLPPNRAGVLLSYSFGVEQIKEGVRRLAIALQNVK